MCDMVQGGMQMVKMAVDTIGSVMAYRAAVADNRRTQREELKNLNAVYNETTHRETKINEAAQAESSDRVRQANRELGTLRVAAGEMGATATSSHLMAGGFGFAEGLDLGRIESNRVERGRAERTSNTQQRQVYKERTRAAYRRARNARTNIFFTAAGSALQLGSSMYSSYQAGHRPGGRVAS